MNDNKKNAEQIVESRAAVYGSYSENTDVIMSFVNAFVKLPYWDHIPSVVKHALIMMATKMGRAATGDWRYVDNWKDIEGYSLLVRNFIVEASGATFADAETKKKEEDELDSSIIRIIREIPFDSMDVPPLARNEEDNDNERLFFDPENTNPVDEKFLIIDNLDPNEKLYYNIVNDKIIECLSFAYKGEKKYCIFRPSLFKSITEKNKDFLCDFPKEEFDMISSSYFFVMHEYENNFGGL